MSMSDPIADMLTRIRNANTAKHDTVDVPSSKMKLAIAEILLKEGYIQKYELVDAGISTVSCLAMFALRILVSISAIESVILAFPPLKITICVLPG